MSRAQDTVNAIRPSASQQDVATSNNFVTSTFTSNTFVTSTFTSNSYAQSIFTKKNWTLISANTTVSAGEKYLANTSSSAITLTLPASPTIGNEIWFADAGSNWRTNNLTVAGNGKNVDGASTFTGDLNEGHFITIYNGGEWIVRFTGGTV